MHDNTLQFVLNKAVLGTNPNHAGPTNKKVYGDKSSKKLLGNSFISFKLAATCAKNSEAFLIKNLKVIFPLQSGGDT